MIRSALKAGLKKVLGVEVKAPAAAPPPPAWKPSVPKPTVVRPPEAANAVAPTPVVVAPVVPAEAAPAAALEEAPKKAPKKKKAEPEVFSDAAAVAVAVAPAEAPAVAEPPPTPAAEAPTDTVGAPAFSMPYVQELFDEMVRPALQGDGGDITLIKIQDNDIYVKLVGSCSTCPSSVLTMKMGVEALLKEELPGFGSLIQVD